MKIKLIPMLIAMFSAPCAVGYVPMPPPWQKETPEGVKEAGELSVFATPYYKDEPLDVACFVQRDPILKQEWIFSNIEPTYEWRTFALGLVQYGELPLVTSPKISIKRRLGVEEVGGCFDPSIETIFVRQTRAINLDYMKTGKSETSTALSYGQVNVPVHD